MSVWSAAESGRFAQGLHPGVDTERLLGPGVAPSPHVLGPMAALSTAAYRLAQTLTEPIALPRQKKMPALVPWGWALVAVGVGSRSRRPTLRPPRSSPWWAPTGSSTAR